MIESSFLKEKNKLDLLQTNMKKRGMVLNSEVVELANSRRKLIQEVEAKQHIKNQLSQQIKEIIIQKQGDSDQVNVSKEKIKNVSNEIRILEARLVDVENKYQEISYTIPNLLDDMVPPGIGESDNVVVREKATSLDLVTNSLDHYTIATQNALIDFQRGVKISGSRFYVYNHVLAKLEREIANMILLCHSKKNYQEKMVPLLVKNECMFGTGQFPKFMQESYHITSDQLNLIPTAEVSLTNLYRDEIFQETDLPLYMMAFTPCFRREAGTAGRDTRGIIRVHQFNKVELVKFCLPNNSNKELESLLQDVEAIVNIFDLRYRIVLLCSGDIGFAASKTYDIEVWMPGSKRWLEISSCSNFKDFQARRSQIRFKDVQTKRNRHIHTLNGSGLALGRLIACLLEYYQTKEGTFDIDSVYKKMSSYKL